MKTALAALATAVVFAAVLSPMSVSAQEDGVAGSEATATPEPGAITGVVWADADGDGIRQQEEESLARVELTLLPSDGAGVESVESDDDGAYRFEGLDAGTYVVRLAPPDGHGVAAAHDAAARASSEESLNAFGEIVDGTSGAVTIETEPVTVEPGAEVVLAAGLTPPPGEAEENAKTPASADAGDVATQADDPDVGIQTATPPDVGTRTATPPGTRISQPQSFYAYVDAGENLDVTFTKSNAGSVTATITVRGPDVADQSCTIPADAAIGTSCSVLDATSATPGVWQIEFARSPAGAGFTWNIDVQDGSTSGTGRVWSERYFMEQGTTINPFNLWYLSEQGFRYQATYANYNGISSIIHADAIGVALLNTCVSAYESMDLIGPNSDTNRLWQPPPGTCGDPFKIFFEAPSADLPATTTRWDGTSTWVAPAPVVPSLANLRFIADSATVRSGTFRFDVTNFSGQLTIEVDANGDGDYTDPVDRSIPAAVAQGGTVDVPFDGDDGAGNPIPATQDIGARVSITQAGEIHFTMADVELRNSISVEALNGPSVGSRTLYWNDTALETVGRNCTTPDFDGRDGVDSTSGVHGWTCSNNANDGTGGSWGDQRAIDDWTFQNVNVTVEAAFAAGLEFGDAPDTYGTTTGADGARHLNTGFDDATNTSPVMLGGSIDLEGDGLPGAAANGDDTTDVDDEDGVAFNPALAYPNPTLRTGADPVSGTPAQNTVQVTASAPGFASVWVDWNVDGDFGDAGEQVANAQAVVAGPNDVTFTQGTNPPQIATYARVRYSTDAADVASPTGAALDGEVEDYRVLLERLIEPSVCFDTPDPFYAFTFQAPTVVAPRALYEDVAVVGGVAVDLVIRRTAGGSNSFGVAAGDDASWNISTGSARTLEYTFYVADTYNIADDTGGTAIAVNAAFTSNDMDGTEEAVFTETDLAAYAISPGSDVTLTDTGTELEFAGNGNHNGDVGSRFLWVITNTSSLSVTWSGFNNSGFAIDGDNDLAFAPSCEDYGDAPESYGTLLADDGPRHTIVDGLQLGAEIDIDPNGQPTAGADGDDLNGLDDEDGVATPIQIAAGTPTNVSVTATNTTAQDATLVGWIDLNGNGAFETGERAIANVPAGSGTNVYDLGFPAGTATATTYARFRLFPGVVADPSPIGTAAGGEVEDYAVQAAAVHFEKTSDPAPEEITEVTPGMVFTYTIEVENIGLVPVTGISFVDDLTEVVDDATVTSAPTASIGTAAFVPPDQITWTGDLGVGETAIIQYQVTVNDPISGNAILLNGVVGDAPGSNCPPPGPSTDPDCFEQIPAPLIDTEKTLLGPTDPEPGDVVSYQFTVTNIGAAPAFNFQVSDDLAGVLDDAGYNGDASTDLGAVTFDATAQELVWSVAALNPAETATITFSVTVNDATALGDGSLQNALVAPDCPDPAIFDPQDPDYDAECVTVTDVAAWTSVKTSDAVGAVEAGDTVTYTITVTNTGNVALDDPADLPTVTDDLSGVLDDAAYNDNADDGGAGTLDYTAPTLTWTGALAVDDEVTITYSVTVNGPDALDDGRLVNAVTGAPNCPDPAITDPQDPGFDPDCALITAIEAWTAVKTSDVLTPVLAGASINYTITVTNTGSVPIGDFDDLPAVQDDLTDVIDDAAYNDDADSGDDGTLSYTAPVLSWEGALAVDQVVTITYSVTVNDADALGDGQLVNAITGSPNCPDPAVTDPDDPEFDPGCAVLIDISAFTSVKTSDAAGAIAPGDTIIYTITVTNTGNAPLDDPGALPAISDNLSGVLDDAAYNDDADSGDDGTLSYTAPVLSWEGALAVDQVVTITYSVTLAAAGALGDGVLVNAVTGAHNCPDPAVTDPSDPGFDADCALVQAVRSFTTVKTSDAAPAGVMPGDVVTYTITVVNDGGAAIVAPDAAQLTDDLAGVLDDAAYNAGSAMATAGTVGVSGPTLTWSGELDVDQSATITYSVIVNDPPQGDFSLRNAVATNGPMCPAPAVTDPDDPAYDDRCVVTSGVAGVQYEKSIVAPTNPAQIGPGVTLTYRVAVRNVGQVDLTGLSFTDDLSGVIAHAAYLGDAAATIGSVSYSAPILTWTGDLAEGETALVTYSFRLNGNTPAGTALRNTVSGTGPGAHCNVPTGAAASDVTKAQATCVLDTVVGFGPPAPAGPPGPVGPSGPSGPGGLALTGAELVQVVTLGLALLLLGTVLVRRGSHRRRLRLGDEN